MSRAAFDEEGFYRSGEAAAFADPAPLSSAALAEMLYTDPAPGRRHHGHTHPATTDSIIYLLLTYG